MRYLAGCGLVASFLAAGVDGAAAKPALTHYGDIAQAAIPAAAVIGSAAIGDWPGLAQFAASGTVTVLSTFALKAAVRERRPDGSDNRSLPSGHASYAFAGASYLLFRYGWQVGLPAELAAAGVAWSRVDARKHHWYDVTASAAIAHLSGFVLVDPDHPDRSITPWVETRKPGFGIVARLAF
jgi:membrane-associated phospholipid phosphatase